MHRLGNRMHVLTGLWVLAGLLVVGVNGTMLMSLLDEPLAGHSSGVRTADQGLQKYHMLLTAKAEKIAAGMDQLTSRFTPVDVGEEKPAAQTMPARPTHTKKVAPSPVSLPALSGIITSRSSNGKARRLAVMDGRICAEGDRFDHFTVKRIASGGVSLVSGDQDWFLKAPDIAYSVTTQ